MRLTKAQMLASERIQRAASGRMNPEDVAAEIASALAEAISWDGFRLFTIDPEGHGINRLLAASAFDGEMRQRWLRDAYQRDVNVTLKAVQHAERLEQGFRAVVIHERLDHCYGVSAAILATIAESTFYRSYHEHRERHHPDLGHLNAILANFPVNGRWVATLHAYRIDSTQAFMPSDVAFMQLVAPKVGEAIDTALRREQVASRSRAVPGDGASGVLVVHREQGVLYASPVGNAWLEELRRLPADRETLLPTPVWAAIAGVQAGSAMTRTSVASPLGTVMIEASPGGSDGSVALVVSAPVTGDIATPPAVWGLTPAEERIVARAILGESNRTVSDALSISEHTVEWHLRNVFAKLGIHSRSQLAARYGRDLREPVVEGSPVAGNRGPVLTDRTGRPGRR